MKSSLNTIVSSNQHILLSIVLVLGLLFIILQFQKDEYKNIIGFLLLFLVIYLLSNNTKLSFNDRIIYGILISVIVIFILSKLLTRKTKTIYQEGFTDEKDTTEEKENKETTEIKEEITKVLKEEDKEKNDKEGDGDEENYIDAGTTFINAYKNLDKEQIEGMTKDTKELIETQKNLMDTLKTLAPVVTEGKKVLDTFNNYFEK